MPAPGTGRAAEAGVFRGVRWEIGSESPTIPRCCDQSARARKTRLTTAILLCERAYSPLIPACTKDSARLEPVGPTGR